MGFMRRVTQFFGFIISHAYLKVFATKNIYQGPLKATCIPFMACHACPAAVFSCPVGTIQHYMVIRQFPFVLLGHLGIILIAMGRMICGWLCPVGLCQDVMYKIKSPKIKIPTILTYFKYVALIGLVILIPYETGMLSFCELCPSGTLEAALPWVIWNPVNPQFGTTTIDMATLGMHFVMKIFILVGMLVLIVMAKRAFCRIFCPLGIIFGIFNHFSLIRMRVENTESCNEKCHQCLKNCPMELKVYENPNAGECIRCLKCTKCQKVKFGIGDLTKTVFKEPVLQTLRTERPESFRGEAK